jgi:phytoene dehydrogenase-like protein
LLTPFFVLSHSKGNNEGMSTNPDVVIVGAGLAGLCCARTLHAAGVSFQLLEASDGVGGRVRTDVVDRFQLDRGFQVLLESYPEAERVLDYAALDLKPFEPGALIWFGGHMHRFIDPWRKKGEWRAAYDSPVGSLADKLRLARLRRRLGHTPVDKIFAPPDKSARADRSTREGLADEGFSPVMIEHFFEPFFGGILLDRDLKTSSRMFEFIFSMMAKSRVSVPAKGMGAIPAQIATKLPVNSIRVNSPVEKIDGSMVTLAGGEKIQARAVVIATDGPTAAKLLAGSGAAIPAPASRSVSCFYYAADEPPVAEPILVLAGTRGGTVNNLSVMDAVAPGYAPAGKHLVSVTVLGDYSGKDNELTEEQLNGFVIADLKGWFGPVVRSWRLLKSYRIPNAQPEQLPGSLNPAERPVRLSPATYVCGDHRDNASINGAMTSGRRAAEALLADLSS